MRENERLLLTCLPIWSASVASDRDRERLRRASDMLGSLVDEFVFVGGTMTSLMITDPAASETRVTDDIDVILSAATRSQYYQVEQRLLALGFSQRPHNEHPICRWFREEVILDVMPDDASILGFSNRWYATAFEDARTFSVGDGRTVRVISPALFVATKLEAFAGRGHGDFQASRDIEDLVAVIDGRSELHGEISVAPPEVRAYLAAQLGALLAAEDFLSSLPGHLAGDHARMPIVVSRVEEISKL